MSNASRFVMFGEHFAREYLLSESHTILKDSLNIFRINQLSNGIGRTLEPSTFNSESLRLEDRNKDFVSKNVQLIETDIGCDVSYFEFSFSNYFQITKGQITSREIHTEKSFSDSLGRSILKKFSLSKEVLYDAMCVHPIIPEDQYSGELNKAIFNKLFKDIDIKTEVVILSGEMIWSGWITLATVLEWISRMKRTNILVIIDSWGYLQQSLSLESLDIKANEILESLSTSIFVDYLGKLVNYRGDIDTKSPIGNINLYRNISYTRNSKSGFKHRPDYLFLLGRVDKKQKVSSDVLNIPLGVPFKKPPYINAASLRRRKLKLKFPYECVIQNAPQGNIGYLQDIGQMPVLSSAYLSLKFSKKYSQTVDSLKLMEKGETVGEKRVLKRLLAEKVQSPVRGRIDNRYIDWGLLRFIMAEGTIPFQSPFEGEILGVNKLCNQTQVNVYAESFTIPVTFSKGPEVEGTITSISDISSNNEVSNIIILKKNDIGTITKEFIVKKNIVGFILIDFNYKALKDFFEKQLLSSKNIRLSLIYPLSNSWQGPITDLLYLLSGRRAILEKDKLHILIDKRTKKELYLRLNSKKKSTDMNLYKKGDEVFYLNYKQYYFYGRIEKVSKEDVVLMSSGEVLRGKFPNIIKYYYG